jgi:hypothetical protein
LRDESIWFRASLLLAHPTAARPVPTTRPAAIPGGPATWRRSGAAIAPLTVKGSFTGSPDRHGSSRATSRTPLPSAVFRFNSLKGLVKVLERWPGQLPRGDDSRAAAPRWGCHDSAAVSSDLTFVAPSQPRRGGARPDQRRGGWRSAQEAACCPRRRRAAGDGIFRSEDQYPPPPPPVFGGATYSPV